jgi:hypothetical protein
MYRIRAIGKVAPALLSSFGRKGSVDGFSTFEFQACIGLIFELICGTGPQIEEGQTLREL